MLTLTRKTEYALIALTYLADEQGRLASAREIAETFNIPQPVLTNILKTLAKAGIIASHRGVHGGYRLSGETETITLASIIAAVEGPVKLVPCSDHKPGDPPLNCCVQGKCPVQKPVQRLHERVKIFLNDVKLSDITYKEIVQEKSAG